MQAMSTSFRSIGPTSPISSNSAYYDPSTKRIYYSKRSHTAIANDLVTHGIVGAVIGGSHASFRSGRILKGEILEINDVPEETNALKQPQSCDDSKNNPSAALSQNELLKKQQHLEQIHPEQSQALSRRHTKESQNFNKIPMPSEDHRERAWMELQERHEQELLELRDAHQKEQIEIMNSMLRSVLVKEQSDRCVQQDQGQPGRQPQHEQQGDCEQLVSKVAARQRVTADPVVKPRNTSTSDPIASCYQISQNKEPVLDKATLEKQKADEIKALMRDKSLDTERRHSGLIEIKERYSKLFLQSSEGEQSIADRRRSELQAVMKDRSLTKDERTKRLAEVKAKYHGDSQGGHRRVSVDAAPSETDLAPNRWKQASSAVAAGRAFTNTVSTRVDQPGPPPVEHEMEENVASNRWNRAAVTAFASNVMSQNLHDEHPKAEAYTMFSSSMNVSEHWNRAAVKALTAKIVANVTKENNLSSPSRRVTISEPNSQNNSAKSLKVDPLEVAEVSKTPIKQLIKNIAENDPSLTVLKLDGRGKIKQSEWQAFFESLETNTSLTHLSLARCGLTDESVVALILALVENTTLVSLHLMTNREITEVSGKGFIKVLTETNTTIKQLDLSRTRVTKQTLRAIQELMDDRDEDKKRAKIQEMRERKIQELLTTTASDAIKTISLDLSDSDADSEASKGSRSKQSKQKSCNQLNNSLRKSSKSNRSNTSNVSNTSSKNSGRGSKGGSRGRLSGRGSRGSGRGANNAAGSNRASLTTRQMATLGGDIVSGVGADKKTLREQRKLRGECVDCGQKCFEKRIFKSTPLTIPQLVFEGRCLKCRPM
ncbi:hypothetical protein ACHAW6_011104 [Cyclotella cf. meneghiniana]